MRSFPLAFAERALVASLLLSAAATVAAQSKAPGVFSAAQAVRGEAVYKAECAACHGPNLEGAASLPLAGERFMAKWGQGRNTVDDLYYITKTQMPFGRGNSLTAKQYIDVTAFMLAKNGYPSGARELSSESPALKQIQIVRQGASTQAIPSGPVAASIGRPQSSKPTQAELNSASGKSEWLVSNHDYGGQRFVDLKQINRGNVASLKVAARYQAGGFGAFHTNPIVHDGRMYITTTNSTIALDAATLKQVWRFDRQPKGPEGWPQNRGVAIKDGHVIRGTHDGYLLSLDAQSGKLLWERALVDMTKNEGGFTMAPVIYQDMIFIGPAGSELGVKGWVGAFRLDNGEPIWRFNTVPDDGEPGADTWGNVDARLKGGGAVWAPLSLDVEQGLVYVPVANPAPDFYPDVRPGKNLYTSSMVALDARTGQLRWHYQAVPNDEHDWDLTQVSPLFDSKVNGQARKLVATVGKDGLLHVLDRNSHEHLYATPVTTRSNTDTPLTQKGVRVCPGVLGGVQWNGPAFNPGTNMLYVNAVDWCAVFTKAPELRYIEGKFYMGGSANLESKRKARGWLTAIDASTGQVRWKYESKRPLLAAVTTTSADLVLTGELLGDFVALDARDGKVLYRFNTGATMNGGVVSYEIAGKQYIAVASGSATGFWEAPRGPATILSFSLP